MIFGNITFLRRVKSEDFPFIMEWENDPEMWPISETPGPFDEKTIRNFIDLSGNLEIDAQERWVIFAHNNRPVGLIDFFSFDSSSKSAGIGIMIAKKTDRRHGFAYDAIMTMLENLRESARVNSLRALIYTDNEPSIKLFGKCGFDAKGTKYYRGKPAIQFVKYL